MITSFCVNERPCLYEPSKSLLYLRSSVTWLFPQTCLPLFHAHSASQPPTYNSFAQTLARPLTAAYAAASVAVRLARSDPVVRASAPNGRPHRPHFVRFLFSIVSFRSFSPLYLVLLDKFFQYALHVCSRNPRRLASLRADLRCVLPLDSLL